MFEAKDCGIRYFLCQFEEIGFIKCRHKFEFKLGALTSFGIFELM